MDYFSTRAVSVAVGAVATAVSYELLQKPESREAIMRWGKPVLVFAAKSASEFLGAKLGGSAADGFGPVAAAG